MIKTRTDEERQYDRFWETVMGRERIILQIKACKKVLITLSDAPFVHNDALQINMEKDGMDMMP